MLKNNKGIEELLSDMLIRQDRLIEALKTNTMILKELADGQKNLVEVQKELLKEHHAFSPGQKQMLQKQKKLENSFAELYQYLKNHLKE